MPRATSFEGLVSPELVRGLRRLGIVAPNTIQADAIPLALSGRDLMVCAQTGSGKTLVFLLPILQRLLERTSDVPGMEGCGPEALVLAPTDQLAMQVASVAEELAPGLSLESYTSTTAEPGEQQRSKAPRLLIGTPDWALKRLGGHSALQLLAVDEADALLCRPSRPEHEEAAAAQQRLAAEELLRGIEAKSHGPQLFLTMAHLTEAREEELVCRFPGAQRVGHTGVLVPTLRQCFHYFRGDKDSKLLWVLSEAEDEDSEPLAGATMVFCSAAAGAERLRMLLEETKPSRKPLALHEETPADQRAAIARAFREGEVQVLVATDSAARGLDFPRLRHVVMYDTPVDATAFVHCAGRTARRGNTGLVTCIVEAGDAARYQFDGKNLHSLEDAPQLKFASSDLGACEQSGAAVPASPSSRSRGSRGYRGGRGRWAARR